jgi:hypothetical protein
MPCSCDWDGPDIYDARERRARRRHVCDECGEVIEPGERYYHHSNLSDGEWSHYKTCEFCEHDADIVADAGLCWRLGELEDAWKEMWEG